MSPGRASVLIGPAKAADAPACADLMLGWIDETVWIPRVNSRDEAVAYLAGMIAQGRVSVARRSARPLGFLARDGARIHALYVSRAARGRGIGKALLDHAKAQVGRLELWTFEANTGAQRFYLRQGFCEAGRSDGAGNDEGLPDIRYEWSKAHE